MYNDVIKRDQKKKYNNNSRDFFYLNCDICMFYSTEKYANYKSQKTLIYKGLFDSH